LVCSFWRWARITCFILSTLSRTLLRPCSRRGHHPQPPTVQASQMQRKSRYMLLQRRRPFLLSWVSRLLSSEHAAMMDRGVLIPQGSRDNTAWLKHC
jgi:hypothetical protein